MAKFLDALKDQVLLCDGGMGSLVQAMDLSVDGDFRGKENCTEVLNLSRPDVVRDIHGRYFDAGADCVETNTFGGSSVTLAEFDLQDDCEEINKRAAEIAREAAEAYSDGRQRFVLGSIGPGTKLPSLDHITYDEAKAGFRRQCDGLIAGGSDAVLIETCQDMLQVKAAANAAKEARAAAGTDTPILLQVTVETTGTMLVGTEISAAATVARSLGVDSLGLNCATGPQEMAEHVHWLAENWPGFITLQPNAGLPELLDGKTHYPLGPKELADWHRRFVLEDGAAMIGGCCGTTPDHIRAVDAMLQDLAREGGRAVRPEPVRRTVHWVPTLASLYSPVAMRQENAFLSIGERCNANGSKKFREYQDAENWDAAVGMARDQVKEGSNTLDVCTAFVGRDEVSDMSNMVSRLRGAVTAPLVFDSTETPVLEASLKLYGGKGILNSIHFEDGEPPVDVRLDMAREFGAAVVALTIDEEGMAKDAEGKLRIARRLYDIAVNKHGLEPSDLMFDPLTFTICTGNEDDRRLAIETLEGIRLIAEDMPDCQIVLGLSNISFGLKPAARHVLNSVFLDHALKAGMTSAIVHVSKIMPLHKIPAKEVEAAEDLIFDRRKGDDHDPLQAFIALFADRKGGAKKQKVRPATVEERLKQRIIDGDRQGLEEDLDVAMKSYAPLEIINTLLLDGMKVVGELFGAGKMQLPFVLQSAETMKTAVAYLEPFMEKVEGQEKGIIVLATVKGDVHDIGKNLVDIILTNNGYKVVNLGIKQPITTIMQAAKDHKADAVGMSGLLVKSTVIMRENLAEMARNGLDVPVFLGGAALTRAYVEEDCTAAYGNAGRVAYARDAFDGLDLMAKVVEERFDDHLEEVRAKREGRPSRRKAANDDAPSDTPSDDDQEAVKKPWERPVEAEELKLRRAELAAGYDVPDAPFFGGKVVEDIPVKALLPYVNEQTLFQFQWGFRKSGKTRTEYQDWAKAELKPILVDMIRTCEQEKILQPKAVYGYWPAASEKDSILLFAEDGKTEVARFDLPRQNREGGICLSDFVRDVDSGERDVIGLQAVTVGAKASDIARDWFADNRYKDYLYLHGISVEVAEAMAEYVHKRIRAELGFSAEDARSIDRLIKQEYRGSRYSFGYPACPNLGDQKILLDLLGAQEIGLELSDEDELVPEQSTSALVLLHPQAKYFRI
ncbi:MAG: methionine synthase [Rhodospirillaceae bacterium]